MSRHISGGTQQIHSAHLRPLAATTAGRSLPGMQAAIRKKSSTNITVIQLPWRHRRRQRRRRASRASSEPNRFTTSGKSSNRCPSWSSGLQETWELVLGLKSSSLWRGLSITTAHFSLRPRGLGPKREAGIVRTAARGRPRRVSFSENFFQKMSRPKLRTSLRRRIPRRKGSATF